MWKGSIKSNWFVPTVVKYRFKIALNMEKTLYNLSVNSVVRLLNGFVGEILIFVKPVIKSSVLVNMYQSIPRINYQNVKVLEFVQVEEITMAMEIKK